MDLRLQICNFLIFSDGWSADRSAAPRIAPTIARLSFWLSPDRFSEFETTYREKLVPILKKHGLEESSERGRATIDGVFSRLFEVRAPSEIPERNNALRNDTAWTAILKALGESFGTNRNDGTIRHSLHLYAAPGAPPRVVSAGTGKIVPAGTGRGHWRTYDVTDGLADVNVQDILQDREGALWFATSNGVSRYDPLRLADARSGQASTSSGQALLRLSGTKRSSARDIVLSIIQDRDGEIWFGTTGGVGRYDGKSLYHFYQERWTGGQLCGDGL